MSSSRATACYHLREELSFLLVILLLALQKDYPNVCVNMYLCVYVIYVYICMYVYSTSQKFGHTFACIFLIFTTFYAEDRYTKKK